jgi:hypothetical protein
LVLTETSSTGALVFGFEVATRATLFCVFVGAFFVEVFFAEAFFAEAFFAEAFFAGAFFTERATFDLSLAGSSSRPQGTA